MTEAQKQELLSAALFACTKIVEASLFWNSEMEKNIPALKTARTLAGYAIELNQQYSKEE